MRSVDEWVGKGDNAITPARVRVRILERAQKRCQSCAATILGGRWQCDHIQAIINGGENRESNLQVLCLGCHSLKTKQDVAEKSKVYRLKMKDAGIKSKKKSWGYGKNDKYKMKIGGRLVLRNGG